MLFKLNKSEHTIGALSRSAVIMSLFGFIGTAVSGYDAHAQSAGDLALDEVIVTAQKREENLQDVPISISAVSGEQIDNLGIQDFLDFSDQVPGLRLVTPRGDAATSIGIRGISSGFNRGFEQSVALVVDGVYNSRAEAYRAGMLDVERVEVLKGPQGTLFGKNSTAGVVSLVSKDPGDEFDVSITGRAGSEGARGLLTTVDVPLGDWLAMRVAYNDYSRDGYVENTFDAVDGGSVDDRNYRIKLVGEPNDELTFKLTYESSEANNTGSTKVINLDPTHHFLAFRGVPAAAGSCSAPQLFNAGTCLNYFTAADPNFTADREDGKMSNDLNIFFDTEMENLRFQGEYALGDYTISYVGGHSELEEASLFGPDFSAHPHLSANTAIDADQTSHEIRLESPQDEKFRWTVGVFQYEMDYSTSSDVTIFVPPAIPGANPPATLRGNFAAYLQGFGRVGQRLSNFTQEQEASAIFASLSYDATDEVTVTLAGRHTEEEKKSSIWMANTNARNITPAGTVQLPPPARPNFLAALDRTVVPFCFSDEGSTEYSSAARTGAPCGPSRELDDSNFSPMMNIQWDYDDDKMVYFKVAEGYKSGGFNANARKPLFLEFGEETVTSFEIGTKSILMDGRLRLNAAIYKAEYDDWQVSQFVEENFVTQNAGQATTEGLEIDGQFMITQNLISSFGLALTDAVYDSFPSGTCTNAQLSLLPTAGPPGTALRGACTQDLSGRDIEQSPDMEANLRLSYFRPLGSYNLGLSGSAYYSDEYFVSSDLDPIHLQESYTKFDLRASLAPETEQWEIAILGKNISDEIILLNGADVPAQSGAAFGNMSIGRTYEVQFKYNF